MSQRKEDYMRGYGEGFREARREYQALMAEMVGEIKTTVAVIDSGCGGELRPDDLQELLKKANALGVAS